MAVEGFSWLQLLSAALGGGLTVKALDIVYQEVRRRFDTKESAAKFIDQRLDPLLKAADELTGKLHSLAVEDFGSLQKSLVIRAPINNDFGNLLFLFASFWAQIEVIRRLGLSIAITRDQRGKRLQKFFACLESTRIRLVDRATQRAIGELLLDKSDRNNTIGYVEFIRSMETSEEFKRWFAPLAGTVAKAKNTAARQRILQYGIVVHALIDNLDEGHVVTSNRPSYPNKLTNKTQREMSFRVFGVYLDFVSRRDKYLKKIDVRKRLGGPK